MHLENSTQLVYNNVHLTWVPNTDHHNVMLEVKLTPKLKATRFKNKNRKKAKGKNSKRLACQHKVMYPKLTTKNPQNGVRPKSRLPSCGSVAWRGATDQLSSQTDEILILTLTCKF